MIEAPDGRGVLIDTTRGLFVLASDNTITKLQSRDGSFTRSFASLPWSGEVLAAGGIQDIIRRDLSVLELTRNRFSMMLGVFPSIRAALVVTGDSGGPIQIIKSESDQYRVVDTKQLRREAGVFIDAPWFGEPLVANWQGLFKFTEEGRLDTFEVDGLSPSRGRSFVSGLGINGGKNFFSVPRLQTIYVFKDGWFRITPERRWLPVSGLDAKVKVLAVSDPGAGDVLFGTTEGIFAVSPEGRARRLTSNIAPSRTIRALSATARPGYILAGGDEGLFEVHGETQEVRRAENGSDDVIGSVRNIIDVPFAKLGIIEASNGTFVRDDHGTASVANLSTSSGIAEVIPLDGVRRVLAKAYRGNEPLLYELARRGPEGACLSPL
jgi:hypothetical protein